MTLLKGPKLLNADYLMPSKTTMTTTFGSDENWLIGCLFLLGSSVAGSIWLILQVFDSDNIRITFSVSIFVSL